MRRRTRHVLSFEERIELLKRRGLFVLAESHAEANGCSLDEVLSDARSVTVCRARHEVASVLYETGRSTLEVGEMIGRDHQVVLHSLRVCGVKRRLKSSGKAA